MTVQRQLAEDERRTKTYNPKTIPIVIDEDCSVGIPITIPPSKIRLDNVTIEISFNAVDNEKSTDTKSNIRR